MLRSLIVNPTCKYALGAFLLFIGFFGLSTREATAAQVLYVGDDHTPGGILQFNLPFSAGSTPNCTIAVNNAVGIASDASGNVLISDNAGYVRPFHAPLSSASTSPMVFSGGYEMAFTPGADFFASTQGTGVNRFTRPFSNASKPSQIITHAGLTQTMGVALDGAQNLYVSNVGAGGNISNVFVFAPPYTGVPVTTPAVTTTAYRSVAVSGTALFVASVAGTTGRVDVYALPITTSSAPAFSLTNGVNLPEGLALDSAGNLYVGNLGDATVSVFSPPMTQFSSPVTTVTVGDPNSFAIFGITIGNSASIAGRGDFNGDGKTDVLTRNSATGDIGMWLMNGETVVSSSLVGSPGVSYTVAGVGDFNGDGKADVLLRDNLGNLGMWLMNGSTIIGGASVGSPGATYTVEAVADFNGDGKTDILLRDGAGNLGMWLMNGTSVASAAFVGSPGAGYSVVAAADFNGDGKADILLRDSLGNLGMWLMNGSTITSGAFVGSPGGSYGVAGAADYNGDGKADILLRDGLGNLGMWMMNGPVIVSGAYVGSPGGYYVAGVGNYDGDTHSDILLRNENTGDVGMWLMNGPNITNGGLVGGLPQVSEIR